MAKVSRGKDLSASSSQLRDGSNDYWQINRTLEGGVIATEWMIRLLSTGRLWPGPVNAALSADGRTLRIAVVNNAEYNELTANLQINGFNATTGRLWRLAADSYTAHNDGGNPTNVILQEEPVQVPLTALTLPPHSVTFVELELGAAEAVSFRVTREGDVYAAGAFFCGLSAGCFNSGSGADLAEWVPVSEPVEPGDALEIDPEHPGSYRKALGLDSRLAIGVVSQAPGFVLGKSDRNGALLVLLGTVMVKATAENGPIRSGDLLIASSMSGYAMRCADVQRCEGAIIGKALEALEDREDMIWILVMR